MIWQTARRRRSRRRARRRRSWRQAWIQNPWPTFPIRDLFHLFVTLCVYIIFLVSLKIITHDLSCLQCTKIESAKFVLLPQSVAVEC
jgi:hypothetical protein